MAEPYEDDVLVYIPFEKAPDYFKAAYKSHDEMLGEIKEHFVELEVEFPENFDWWRRIACISGTFCC